MTPPAHQDRRTPAPPNAAHGPVPDGSPVGVWLAVLDRFRVEHPDLFRGWFPRLRPRRLRGGILTLDSENEAQARYLETHCRDALTATAQQATGRLISLAFSAPSSADHHDARVRAPGAEGPALDPWMTFEAFAAGPCNRLAHAAATALATDPEPSFRLLYLHGPAGSGKTHLLQAIGHTVRKSTPNGFRFDPCDRFSREWIEAVEGGREHAFRRAHRELAWFVVDDVDLLADRVRSQEEFFHTLNALQHLQARIAVSAVSPPGELPNLEPRLRDRLAAGFVAPLDLPCRETRLGIVQSLSRTRCIDVPDGVASILAEPEGLSAADLAAALTWLDAQSQTAGGRITEGLAGAWRDSCGRSAGVSEAAVLK